jgi:hypothetical protein
MAVSLFGIFLFHREGQICSKKKPDDLVKQPVSLLLQPLVKVGLTVKKVENPMLLRIISMVIRCLHLFVSPFKTISLILSFVHMN